MRERRRGGRWAEQRTRRAGSAPAVLAAFLSSLLLATSGWGSSIDAPVLVRADPAGAFCYEAAFTAGPRGDEIYAFDVSDAGNTTAGFFVGDLFCLFPLGPGERETLVNFGGIGCDDIGGSLVDPLAEGFVFISVQTLDCPGGTGRSFEHTTTILPFSTPGCIDNSECVPEDLCQKPAGEFGSGLCDDLGSCVLRPTSCAPDPVNVCGCDGIDYDNACQAALAGTSVWLASFCPTPTPTPTPSATPTPTPTPALGDCLCVPQGVTPSGNLVSLRNTGEAGKGSALDKSISVSLQGQDVTPGSCSASATSNPVILHLRMLDDDGEVILDRSKTGVVCSGSGPIHVKFTARYDVSNCKGSVAPVNTSKGDVSIEARTGHGLLEATGKVHCKR